MTTPEAGDYNWTTRGLQRNVDYVFPKAIQSCPDTDGLPCVSTARGARECVEFSTRVDRFWQIPFGDYPGV